MNWKVKKFTIIVLVFFMMCATTCTLCACPSGDIPPNGDEPQEDETPQEVDTMYITINGNKLEVTLENNATVKALVEVLQQGDLTYTADDYGGFEKVGHIGRSLPRNDTQITTQAGDVVLYLGNQICIMVGSNSWAYTRIGKINGHTATELKKLVGIGSGSAEVTLSLH